MVSDVEALDPATWRRQNYIDDDGTIREAWVDWRCLPLRSIGGSGTRTDPGAEGLVDYAATPWLAKAPYLEEILATFPAPVRAARLLALGGGMEGPEHCDDKYGLAWGVARLHLPIITTPGARLYLDGQIFQWQPGELWFGDFTRMHKVENTDRELRIHLVFDALVTDGLMQLFPDDYVRTLGDRVLLNKPATRALVPNAYRVRFPIPTSFANHEEPEGQFLEPQEHKPAVIDVVDSEPLLTIDGTPTLGLVHIGDGEFRFLGWTDERTIQVSGPQAHPTVTLRSREGRRVRSLEISAVRLS
jgi:hypothetical protein